MATLSDLFGTYRGLNPDDGYDNDFPLESALIDKLVRYQTHPTLPLAILNYTEQAQYKQMWNDVTLNCRGLIFNYETGEIIARGFPKFFNWDDSSQPYPPHGPVLRAPKMDGSLGILYWDGTQRRPWAIATRGSFSSDQANVATDMLYGINRDGEIDLADLKPDKTYLCEIIYPENRIVVDYGGEERLVLLDVLDTATGKTDLEEFDRVYWLDKVEKTYLPGGFEDTMASDIPEGEEGFVIYWPERDYRVKMKAAAYLELHRMIFSLSERSVWERMGNGESVENIATALPDEFHDWVRRVGNELKLKQQDVTEQALRDYREALLSMKPEYYDGVPLTDATKQDRKAFAKEAAKYPTRAYLFMLYDGDSGFRLQDAIWKTLRPEGNKTVTTISEDVA